MARIPGIRSLFRLPATEGRVGGEVDDEIAFHLEERTQELVRRGVDPAAARQEALREFGDVGEARAELEAIDRRRVRQAHRSGWWSDLGQDLRYAARTLAHAPGFAAVAVLTLALGIGATTAIYTVVDGVLLRPLGVAAPERLVLVRERPAELDRPLPVVGTVSPANFYDWQEQAEAFSSMSYFTEWPGNLTGGGEPYEATVQHTSANFFTTLGVEPLLGRGFAAEEDDPGGESFGGAQVAVLSHDLWRSRYGGDPGIVGRTVELDGEPRTVVGVMGPDVRVLEGTPDLWVPLGVEAGNRTTMGRFLAGVARLRPEVPLERAEEEMATIAARLEAEYPDFNSDMGVLLTPWREAVVGEVRPALLVLLGAAGILLLIACVNVANLLLGRASTRRREIAVRLSLGATRGRLVRQLLTESLLLATAGGVLGVAAAVVGTRALLGALPESVQLPRMDVVQVDARVMLFALAVSVLTGILFGLAPAITASRQELQGTLRDESRGSTSGRGALRLRNGLVVAEVGLALMLLVGAGLLLRSFQNLQAVDTGFQAQGALTFRLSLGSDGYAAPDARRGFTERLRAELGALPGVQSVGTVSTLPLTEGGTVHTAYRVDRPAPEPSESPSVGIAIAGGDYFRAQGIQVVRGRAFDARDHADAPTTFVVNETLAREQFPDEDPIGKRLTFPWGDTPVEGTIVGVVEDVRSATVTDPPIQALYRAYPQSPVGQLNVVVRATGEPLALAGAAREAVGRLDANLPVSGVRAMEEVVGNATARSRVSSYLLAGFAALALILAAVGLYGIISYGVAQRRGELGVRVALGADRSRILRLIVGQGLVLTVGGLVLGLLGAFALTRLLRSMLYQVAPADPLTFAAVPLLLLAVALAASYLPASRAARVDPADALRG